jgi:ABC-type dipeptide/oligopeptide/nickel transport system permease subunit
MTQQTEIQRQPLAVLPAAAAPSAKTEVAGFLVFARRYPAGCAGAAILAIVAFLAMAAPLVTVYDPNQVKLRERKELPSWSHPLGTDYEGRDILTRIIYGGRVSLAVAFLAVLLGTTVGAVWGVASAYIGGRFDLNSQRLLEIFMSFPPLILAMVLVVGIGAGLWAVVIAIGVTRLPFGVRVVRAVALSLKELTYVEAARVIGASNVRIMVQHIAPQCMAPFLVLATAQLGVAVVLEASLGFLGVGIPPPTPTWGNMMGGAVANVLIPHWPLVVFPGVTITIVVLAFNFFGDAIRDALDPRLRNSQGFTLGT